MSAKESKNKNAIDPNMPYEDALAELEQLVQRMESAHVPLDDVLLNFQKGHALLTLCRDRLQHVEQQVRVFEQGAMQDWNPPA